MFLKGQKTGQKTAELAILQAMTNPQPNRRPFTKQAKAKGTPLDVLLFSTHKSHQTAGITLPV
jgi:hypothetical protein